MVSEKMLAINRVIGFVAIATASLLPGQEAELPPSSQQVEVVEVSTLSIDELIAFNAKHYGVSEEVIHTVINCESGYNSNAVGDGGQSYGLVQIHQPSWHKLISIEESLDPAFAIDFLARNLSEGNGHLWTCYRIHYD